VSFIPGEGPRLADEVGSDAIPDAAAAVRAVTGPLERIA
jgi:hypothetical protein